MMTEQRARLAVLSLEGRERKILDLLHRRGRVPPSDVSVSPLRSDDNVAGAAPIRDPATEKLLRRSVGARHIDIADAVRIRGVEHLPGACAKCVPRTVGAEIAGAIGRDVRGPPDRREPDTDAADPW